MMDWRARLRPCTYLQNGVQQSSMPSPVLQRAPPRALTLVALQCICCICCKSSQAWDLRQGSELRVQALAAEVRPLKSKLTVRER
jgi:hypothetical protein